MSQPQDAAWTGLTVSAAASELRRAAAWLQAEAVARGVPDADIARLDLCLHEALANIIDHAGLPADGAIALGLTVERGAQGGSATLTLDDAGLPFDPTQADAPERPRTLSDTMPGGLGLVMMRNNSDALSHARQDGVNRLSLVVRWLTA